MTHIDERTLPDHEAREVKGSVRDAKAREARLPTEGGEPVPPMRADKHSDADPAVQNPVEARQGFLGQRMLLVLGGGLGLAFVAWLLIEMIY